MVQVYGMAKVVIRFRQGRMVCI